MHSYQHNIKTFNNATRHLTRVERSLYRDLIELYYDTEQPLPANDIDALCRRVLAHSEDEKSAVRCVLEEFFVLTGDVYTQDYCDEVIEDYRRVHTSKALAGKASAEARRKKAAARKSRRRTHNEQKSTPVKQALNGCSTGVRNHKPETINHKPVKNNKHIGDSGEPPATGEGDFVNELFNEFWSQYPRKDGKVAALKSFRKLKPTREFTDRLLADIGKRLGSGAWVDKGPDKQFIPHASTYLNQSRWTDEIIPRADAPPDYSRLAAEAVEFLP